MSEPLIAVGVAAGVVLLVNVGYYVFSRRVSSKELRGVSQEAVDVASAGQETSVPEPVESEDERLLLLRPIEEQEAYKRQKADELREKYPLQEFVDD